MDLHVYIHWPFCESLCPYCDFNSFVIKNFNRRAFLSSYIKEIEYFANKISKTYKVTTIYFGGGTPSLMHDSEISEILHCIKQNFKIIDNPEVTIEANPSSSSQENFQKYSKIGINRISIGVQSFNENNLKFLGRKHSKDEAILAINGAKQCFENYSFDLIYGLKNQTVKDFQFELEFALEKFSPPHISIYNLTIEKNTPFFTMHKNGKLNLPNQDINDEMYDLTKVICERNNLKQYEVSNFSKLGCESKHNMGYWKIKDYLGIGAGAHGRIFVNGERFETMNFHKPQIWLKNIEKFGHSMEIFDKITEKNQINEILLMGLRIKDGIDIFEIKNRLKIDLFSKISLQSLIKLKNDEMINFDANKIIPTTKGINFVNYIAKCLLEF